MVQPIGAGPVYIPPSVDVATSCQQMEHSIEKVKEALQNLLQDPSSAKDPHFQEQFCKEIMHLKNLIEPILGMQE